MKMHALKLAGLGITGSVIWRFLQSKHGFSAFSHIFSAADDSSFFLLSFFDLVNVFSRQFVPFNPDHEVLSIASLCVPNFWRCFVAKLHVLSGNLVT